MSERSEPAAHLVGMSISDMDPGRVLTVGDLHGNTGAAIAMATHAAVVHADVIIQVGDFGYWGGPSGDAFQRKLARRLEQLGLQLLWLDGNHEHHVKLNAQPLQADGTHWLWTGIGWSPTIRHLPRGFRWTWSGTTWAACGGASSVDRKLRTAGVDWFPEEEIIDDQVDAIIAAGRADVLVTHDAPLGVPFLRQRLQQDLPAWRRESLWSTGAMSRSDEHMRRVRSLLDGVDARVSVHGHHHVAYHDILQTDHGPVEVHGLGMDRDPLQQLVLLVGPDGQPIKEDRCLPAT